MERYIIWDIDGTVVDTRAAISQAYLYALSFVGIEETDGTRIYPYVGKRGWFVFTEYHHLEGETLEKAREQYGSFFEAKGLSLCSLYPGMRELLIRLKHRGAVMTIASARGQRQLETLLSELGVADCFDLIQGTENNAVAADKPKLVEKCIEFMGVEPEQCVMVGDRIFDIAGGQACGTRSIGVTFGFGTREELLECKPDAIVDDVASLGRLLLGDE